jgi:chemosensory pili system protein ChpA (sensor histidine kinase/response regulator)
LAEVFIEELNDIIENIQLFKNELSEDPTSIDILKDLRRQYHTLKGSGRMAEYHAIGEVGWRIESHLNHVIDKDEFYWDNTLKNVIEISLSKIKVWKQELEDNKVMKSIAKAIGENRKNVPVSATLERSSTPQLIIPGNE